MLKSEQRFDALMPAQVEHWNRWNAETREKEVGIVSIEQANVVLSWLRGLGRSDLNIIEVGCGAGWLCADLSRFGRVTGTDLAEQVLARAAQRVVSANFIAGDFMTLDLDAESYDVAVSLEVLAHVGDQAAFLSKIADILRPNGYLMLATQNRPALERNDVPPPAAGQIRRWVNRDELSVLLGERFEIIEMFSITPRFNVGWLRYLNSGKLNSAFAALRLASINALIRRMQEKAWLGWTIMALARKRV
jgi:2-polyprenyl-3-methyl-5-hydroxy-6-metoxy-1,4-benzoquinol methylase